MQAPWLGGKADFEGLMNGNTGIVKEVSVLGYRSEAWG